MSTPTLLLPRASWSPRHDDGDLTLIGLAEAVAVHHTTTHAKDDTPEAEREHMRVLEAIGEERFGTGISYNALVFPSGRAYQGVSFHRRGTHTGGHNSTVRSICYVGNFENDLPTDAALAKGAALIAEGRNRWWRFNAPINGHRDYKATACPGRNLYSWLDELEDGSTWLDLPEFVDNPITPLPPRNSDDLLVDGFWGRATTRRLQRVLGTPVDGIISSQPVAWRDENPGLATGWRWVTNPLGSQAMKALQKHLGFPAGQRDGLVGPYTVRGLQRHLGMKTVDGHLSRESRTIMALQRRLNENRI